MTPGFPLIGLGEPSDGIPSILPTGNTWQAPATTQSMNPLTGILSKVGRAAAGTSNSFLSAVFGNNLQYLTGIIGLLLIAAGIFLFRSVRETIVSVGKTAGKAAAKGAVVAAA